MQVLTGSGPVRGREDRGVWVFKGVPYGADTSGEGRFRPPRPPQPWTGVRDCFDYGPSCPQMTVEQMTGAAVPPEAEALLGVQATEPWMGEDCLVLNVWTPSADVSAKLPVLVWLHGGGWSTGSASWPLYYFDNLARNRQVVVVGINHRLGVLGFLDLSRAGEEFADSGNVGMLDVVAALRWVNANIAGFGGDPDNVTVFGESGGGLKTTTLLAMPSARGLFHKAVAMSGSMMAAHLPEQARAMTDTVLEHLGIGDEAGDLQAVDPARLIGAEVAVSPGLVVGRLHGFGPVLGPSLPQHPEAAIRAGSAADVTVVSGCTTDEMMVYLQSDPEFWTMSEEDLRDRLAMALEDEVERVLSGYQAVRPGESPTSLLIAIVTDSSMRMPHVRLAEAKVAGGGEPVYMYLFAWGPPDPLGRVRAGHGSDMPYFFDNIDKAPMAAGPHADVLVAAMSGSLAGLAHRGSPDQEAPPTWPPYTLEKRSTMIFDVPPRIEDDPYGEERLVWNGIAVRGL